MKTQVDKALIFFLKYPELGKLKSRLAKDIGDEATLQLCLCFLEDILDKLLLLNCDVFVFLSPSEKVSSMEQMTNNRYPVYPQEGADLGERMLRSFETLWGLNYKRALILGSDIPDFPVSVINDGFEGLVRFDAVIGPTFDGGYYTLGFKREFFLPSLFKNIQWSTEIVFKQTMDIFKKNSLKVKLLPKWGDIDTVGDLIPLIERNKETDFNSSKTIAFLRANSHILTSKGPSQ